MNEIRKFSSIAEAAKQLTIDKSIIRRVLNNDQKAARGFIFKYLE